MRRIYLILALLVILLGLFHTVSTARFFDAFNSRAIWFASGGLLLVLTGVLNLLNRSYGARASGVRWATIATNMVMTVFAALAGIAGAASGAQLAVIVGLIAATTLVSALPRAISG
ncbi:hypothetical protein [Sphingosinicella sp.]|uniref:hypothetical protein n=1 Tax=Sphingosinicella sp. TaxID=1917971 RepID=UPI004037D0E0